MREQILIGNCKQLYRLKYYYFYFYMKLKGKTKRKQ